MRKTRRTTVVHFILTAALVTASGLAQENYGAISGTVLAQTGASINTPSLPRPIEVETDGTGRYAMQFLLEAI